MPLQTAMVGTQTDIPLPGLQEAVWSPPLEMQILYYKIMSSILEGMSSWVHLSYAGVFLGSAYFHIALLKFHEETNPSISSQRCPCSFKQILGKCWKVRELHFRKHGSVFPFCFPSLVNVPKLLQNKIILLQIPYRVLEQ